MGSRGSPSAECFWETRVAAVWEPGPLGEERARVSPAAGSFQASPRRQVASQAGEALDLLLSDHPETVWGGAGEVSGWSVYFQVRALSSRAQVGRSDVLQVM